jgi:hypothetical protein
VVVHVELMLLEERNRVLVEGHLRKYGQLFPVEHVLLSVFDAFLQLSDAVSDLVLIHED